MPRKKSFLLTDAEHRIMEVLWEKGSGTVAQVTDTLAGEQGSAYNTILTLMRILRVKGYLACRKRGRAHVYTPRVNRQAAARRAAFQLLRKFFDDSPGALVLNFLQNEDLNPEELDELKRRVRGSEPMKKQS